MVTLTERQKIIAEKIRSLGGGITADIGSDHGYLPVYLYREGISDKVFASDISEFSIEKIKINLLRFKIPEQKVIPVLSDGLSFLSLPEFAEYTGKIKFIVISGLGGKKIFDIISEAGKINIENKTFILQPVTGVENLRELLWNNGFEIKDETPVYDYGRLYITLTADFTGKPEIYTCAELLMGKLIPKENSLFEIYREKNLKRLERIILYLEKLPSEKKFATVTEFGYYEEVKKLISDIETFKK